jgi:hypothetical protein
VVGNGDCRFPWTNAYVGRCSASNAILAQLYCQDRTTLESLNFLSAAHALYKSVGFAEITPYAENGMTKYQPPGAMDRYRSSAVFMELRL